MKKLFTALLLSGLTLLVGCADKNYIYENYEVGGTLYKDFFQNGVKQREWSANAAMDRYEIFIDEPFITEYHHEFGLSNAFVWLDESEDDARRQLPYSYTVYYQGAPYFLTIDYDIVVGSFGMFIHCFPEMVPRSLLPSSLDFKLSLMWESK